MTLTKSQMHGLAAWTAYIKARKLPRAEQQEAYSVVDCIVDLLQYTSVKMTEFDVDEMLDDVRKHFYAEMIESCPKCGAQVTREDAYEDEGTGEEAGRTFYYCSPECRERH